MLLSIVTVTKDDLDGLINTYRSIIKQLDIDYSSLEWIVINGSLKENVKNYLNTINIEFKYKFISEKDFGIFDAMNKGISFSEGLYIMFLNSGDILHSEYTLNKLFLNINKYRDKIIAGKARLIYDDLTEIIDLQPWVCHQSTVIPKSLLCKYRFDIKKKIYGDLHLWLRLKRDGLFDVVRINEIVCDFLLGGIGNSPNYIWLRFKERIALNKEMGIKSKFIRSLLYNIYMYSLWLVFGIKTYYKASFFINKKRNLLKIKLHLPN
jgi:putative colanic acid biosynthesis glycosyltransferase